jgi:hypothetical protein
MKAYQIIPGIMYTLLVGGGLIKKLAIFRHKTQKFFFFGGITPWNFLADTPIFFADTPIFLLKCKATNVAATYPTGLLTDQPRQFSKIQRTPF